MELVGMAFTFYYSFYNNFSLFLSFLLIFLLSFCSSFYPTSSFSFSIACSFGFAAPSEFLVCLILNDLSSYLHAYGCFWSLSRASVISVPAASAFLSRHRPNARDIWLCWCFLSSLLSYFPFTLVHKQVRYGLKNESIIPVYFLHKQKSTLLTFSLYSLSSFISSGSRTIFAFLWCLRFRMSRNGCTFCGGMWRLGWWWARGLLIWLVRSLLSWLMVSCGLLVFGVQR